jgi:hypothetical protein
MGPRKKPAQAGGKGRAMQRRLRGEPATEQETFREGNASDARKFLRLARAPAGALTVGGIVQN